MTTQAPNDMKFLEIGEKAMVSKLLNVVLKHEMPVTLWLRTQTVRFEARLAQHLESSKRLSLEITDDTVSAETILKGFEAQGSKEILGSFQIQTVNFFFCTHYVTFNEGGRIQIEVPPKLFKLQRRQNLRVTFARHEAPKLTFIDPTKEIDATKPLGPLDILAFRVLDVSSGGVAFAAKPEAKAQFKKGTPLHDMRFRLRNFDIAAIGVVMHTVTTKSDKDEPMLKVGVKFVSLKVQFEKLITQFVLDESRKMFSLIY